MSKLNRRAELHSIDIYNRFKRISQDVSTIPLKAYKHVYKRFNAPCAISINLEGGKPKGRGISMSFNALQAHFSTQTSIL